MKKTTQLKNMLDSLELEFEGQLVDSIQEHLSYHGDSQYSSIRYCCNSRLIHLAPIQKVYTYLYRFNGYRWSLEGDAFIKTMEVIKMARTPGSKDGAGKGKGMPGGGGRNRNPNPCPKRGPGRGKGGGRGGGRNR